MSVVIDTNVAIVANGGHGDAASEECVLACIDALENAMKVGVLVDDGYRVFDEYRGYLSHSGQPGVGDAFFRWLWNNQANTIHCRQVAITEADLAGKVFEEFPDDHELSKFDRSDRKFVAVAIASAENPDILNASDSDWWNFRVPLSRYVAVRFLCPELMQKQGSE